MKACGRLAAGSGPVSSEPGRCGRASLAGFAAALMRAAGVDAAQTDSLVDNLLWNDAAGRHNHGLERLPILLKQVQRGAVTCPPDPVWRDLGPSICHLDAGGAFGQHAGRLATARAMALARATGLGAVGVSGSSFFGTGAAHLAAPVAAGMVALALSNSFPKVAAHGGTRPVLGTNPLAFGAPRSRGRRLLVDMSTAALAGSTLRAAADAGTALAPGLVVDDRGGAVTDPVAALAGTLLPAGGAKGFGLALMVELLAGVLTGAGVGGGVGSLYAPGDGAADNGHFFLVLDIGRWMPRETWETRVEGLCDAVLGSGSGVRIPGQLRDVALAESAARGIPLPANSRAGLARLAGEMSVPLPDWLG